MNKRARRNSIIRKITKTIPYVLASALVVAMIFALVRSNRLSNNNIVTTARISSFSRDYKGSGGTVFYEFSVAGQMYARSNGYARIDSDSGYLLVGKTFPVVYEPGHPANSMILLSPDRFEAFHVPFPDSLNWIRSYFTY
ncbi:hypothetical protein [Chitinophaga sp.]|uniref:DUF3592 domain-containing protein n=1 Tax=Chitinophaga sp. TaxID=1869181 RepID=UPI0031CFEBFD